MNFCNDSLQKLWLLTVEEVPFNMLGEWVMVRDMDILFWRRESRRLLVSVSPLLMTISFQRSRSA